MLQDDDDPFGSYGLIPITLSDKPIFDRFFSTCRTPLSDYTFANTFIWRDSIHLRWKVLHDCLCVFANGDGGLTMLFPPIGLGDCAAALSESLELCEQYNAAEGLAHWTRVEYVSQEWLARLDGLRGLAALGLEFQREPMSGDYIYRTYAMIELAGGDLASKRQARNRFARRHAVRTEDLEPRHVEPCLDLLATWQEQSRASEGPEQGAAPASALRASVQFKKSKEVAAAADALYNARALGLRGMVLYADDRLVGFTLGEMLDAQTCSIVIEKTDRQYVGSAQYIFSEFCRRYWSHTTWCNVGDDWEVPSLAWTKQSYRPSGRLEKCVLRPALAALSAGVAPEELTICDLRLNNEPRLEGSGLCR